MNFFRGIAVPAAKVDEVISTIKTQGLTRDRGEFWKMEYRHPGPLDALFASPDLSLKDTRPDGVVGDPAICACGEVYGAAYYAWHHNRHGENTAPILMGLEVPDDAVAIDGRDFLCTVFQFGNPERARPILERAFGNAVLRYAERAWASSEQSIPLCDLARHDSEVIKAHHANALVIGGRYHSVFRSAFIVRLPINGASMIRVWAPNEEPVLPDPEITLQDIIKRSHG